MPLSYADDLRPPAAVPGARQYAELAFERIALCAAASAPMAHMGNARMTGTDGTNPRRDHALGAGSAGRRGEPPRGRRRRRAALAMRLSGRAAARPANRGATRADDIPEDAMIPKSARRAPRRLTTRRKRIAAAAAL